MLCFLLFYVKLYAEAGICLVVTLNSKSVC